MLNPETAAFLEGGCASIVGTVSGTGEPHAARGWGTSVVSGVEIRLLLDAADAVAIEHLSTTASIAVTGSDVRTLRSVQFKGEVIALEAGTDADRARAQRFCDEFYGALSAIDGTGRALLDRLTPREFVACIVRVTELYDQTPGPNAGASIAGHPS